jgi:hypothetical protein
MESCNGKLCDECLNEHAFSSLAKARRLTEAPRPVAEVPVDGQK